MAQIGDGVGRRALGELSEAFVAARDRLESREPRLREVLSLIDGCDGVKLDEMGWLMPVRMTDGLRLALRESVESEISELQADFAASEKALRGD
jgi:hypothetical protein